MSNNRVVNILGAIVFLLLAAASLYRLLVGIPITVGGVFIGNTSTFFAFVICAALSIMFFRAGRVRE